MKAFPIVFIIFFSLLGLLLYDAIFTKSIANTGIIIEKHYKASHSSSGTGIVQNSNGTTGIVYNSTYDPEEWLIIVKKTDGQYITVSCTNHIYYSKQIGEQLYFNTEYGPITKWQYNSKAY